MKIILDEHDFGTLLRGDTVERGGVEILLESLDYAAFRRLIEDAAALEKTRAAAAPPSPS